MALGSPVESYSCAKQISGFLRVLRAESRLLLTYTARERVRFALLSLQTFANRAGGFIWKENMTGFGNGSTVFMRL